MLLHPLGPSAAMCSIFPHLRRRVTHLAYAGVGHTLDIQRPLEYDAVYDLNAIAAKSQSDNSKPNPYEALREVCNGYVVYFSMLGERGTYDCVSVVHADVDDDDHTSDIESLPAMIPW